MSEENLKLVLVGHVDHGKSTLIGRLFYDTGSLPEGKIEEIQEICESLGKDLEFGYVMDNLSEERDQGVTIDTAQKFFKTGKRRYTIIDAPGHVEFIKNMVTGASQAEAAILIVDAEEGVKEQTRRHAYILGMLGLSQVIVAVNKMDKVSYQEERFNEVKEELIDFLANINITPTYVIPISAREGDFIAEKTSNLSWFDGPSILEALDTFKVPESLSDKPFRLSVQDVYKHEDQRIIAGKITSGTVKPGDEVTVLPSGESTTIKSIVEWKSDKKDCYGFGGLANPESAKAGKSTGVTLTDQLFIDRGDIVSNSQDKPTVSSTLNAHVFWLDKKPYQLSERLTLKCATQEVMCEIEEITRVIDSSTLESIRDNPREIKNREVAEIKIKTSKPIVFEDFNTTPELGRFVFEREDTCAGGIITEAN